MTTFRLYLSAQTPHSGTSGSPSTNTSDAVQADEREPVRVRDAELAQVGGQQREHLAHADALDELGDPEDRDEDAPVLGGVRRWTGHASKVPEAARVTRRATSSSEWDRVPVVVGVTGARVHPAPSRVPTP